MENQPENDKRDEKEPSSSTPGDQKPEEIAKADEVAKSEEHLILVTRVFDLHLDENLVKKQGFLLTLDRSRSSEQLLAGDLARIRTRYEKLLEEYEALQKHRLQAMAEQLAFKKEELKAVVEKQDEYDAYLETLEQERKDLDARLKDLYKEVQAILKTLGTAKQNIVKTALEHLESEIQELMKMSQSLQQEHNKNLEEQYRRDGDVFKEKADFWRALLKEHKNRYDHLTKRLNALANDGITSFTAYFLIAVGGLAALVSGWWFAIWSGPLPREDGSSNISGNSNLRFFFLDHLGKFLGQFSPLSVVGIVLVYLALIGGVSWLCYKLLIRFGFLVDIRRVKSGKAKADKEGDQYAFDVEEMEKILESKIRSNSWWGFWLKLAPIAMALLPLLGVISSQLTKEEEQVAAANKILEAQHKQLLEAQSFQSLFDSMVNEFIGTAIAVMISGFTILYLMRVSEHRYHNQEEAEQGKVFHALYVGFIGFGLMVLAMIMYHYHVPPFDELRRVAIFGFICGCTATAISLSYGYIFSGMRQNADALIYYIEGVSNIVQYYAKPLRVNYTTHYGLRQRVARLQAQMFNLIEGRAVLATAIATGAVVSHAEMKPYAVVTETAEDANLPDKQKSAGKGEEKKEEKDAGEGKTEQKKKKFGEEFGEQAKKIYRKVISVFSRPKPLQPDHTSEEFLDDLKVSPADLQYFPETAIALKELHQRIREISDRKSVMTQEESDYWRNEGTWRSIADQVRNSRNAILDLERQVEKILEQGAAEAEEIRRMQAKEETLLTEGYYTGIWFRDIDPSQQMTIN